MLNFICISKINTRPHLPAARFGVRCARETIDYFGLINSDLKQNSRAREGATQLILRIDCAGYTP